MSKYSQIERERKFIVPESAIMENASNKRIDDDYLQGTMIRLRKTAHDKGVEYKLSKKIAIDVPGVYEITTIYLTEFEFSLFSSFPALCVEKTRYMVQSENYIIGIDRYIKGMDILLIAEMEFDSEAEMNNFHPHFSSYSEVTGQSEFSGYNLAFRFGNWPVSEH